MSTPYSTTQNEFDAPELDPTSTGTSGFKKTNALSHKLTNVLSSSYTDTEIRDALRLLDVRGANNAEETRVNLKYDAQKEVIDANARIVEDFSKVAKQLKRVGALIATLNQTCDDMRTQILAAKQETAPMLEEATILLTRKQETETKQELLDSFCKHFLISDEDLTILTSSAEPVNDQFFTVLSRVKQIHRDCEILLGYENQRLGLELMEQTTRNLDAGYKKLYNWIQREFRGLDLEDPHISGSIRRSLRALAERPALFQNCLDFFAEARQATLSDAFQKALTDTTLGAAKAIEFSTHDPLRYLGDMLAWVHSATVSEMEALEGLFISDADEISRGLNLGKHSDPWARVRQSSMVEPRDEDTDEDGEEAFDGHAALNSLISRNMKTVAQTINQRISLTVRNLSDSVSVYKAFNVLSFYHDMFLKLLGHATKMKIDDNALLTTLDNLKSSTLSHFESTVSEELHSTIDEEPNADSSPPIALQNSLAHFTKIIQTRGPNIDGREFGKLYSVMLKPVLDSCSELGNLLPEPAENNINTSIIYRLNYLVPVRETLDSLVSTIPTASEPLGLVHQEISSLSKSLTSSLAQSFSHTSGVQQLSAALDTSSLQLSEADSAKQLHRHVLATAHLEDLAQDLDTFLAHALMDTQEVLGKLTDKSIAKSVLSDAVSEFIDQFAEVTQKLERADEAWLELKESEEHNGGEERKEDGQEQDEKEHEDEDEDTLLRELYPRTVGEVEALLS